MPFAGAWLARFYKQTILRPIRPSTLETLMAKHDVTVDMPPRPLKRQDVSFTVKRDGSTFGTLKVSNGSVVWFPAGTTHGCKMSWVKFDAMMQECATREERR